MVEFFLMMLGGVGKELVTALSTPHNHSRQIKKRFGFKWRFYYDYIELENEFLVAP